MKPDQTMSIQRGLSKNFANETRDNAMEENSENNPVVIRRSAPVWAQILVWVGLITLLIFLGVGLFRVQHPIMSIGSKVPEFTLRFFDGYQYQDAEQVSLVGLRGKVIVVNFWASWCVTCADEAPTLEAAWRHYQPEEQVVFLGVDYTDVDSKALAFLSEFNITYPNGPDLGTRITPIFNRNIAMPETYIIDQQGVLRYQQIGPFQSQAEILAAIDPLLGGK
jgi:cytochrome c biogenesis protein CcmG, thiol:disulfide interchange protein DsbE